MFELVAYCNGAECWRRPLADAETKKVGSLAKGDPRVEPEFTSDWVVPDPALSGWHLTVLRQGDLLKVQRRLAPRPTSKKVLVDGKPCDTFELLDGEEFTIESSTARFQWSAVEAAEEEEPIKEPRHDTKTFLPDDLRNLSYQTARIGADALDELARLGQMRIGRDKAAEEIARIVVDGLPDVHRAAVVHCPRQGAPQVVAEKARPSAHSKGAFPLSQTLLERALDVEFKPTVRDYLNPTKGDGGATVKVEVDWAICAPLANAIERTALYVVGAEAVPGSRVSREKKLKEAVKFVDLAASVLGVILKNLVLEEEKGRLRKFPPKALLPLLKLGAAEYTRLIEPRACAITILFCDLRGFSLFSEANSSELLLASRKVRSALNIIGLAIDQYEGVIGDLQGDAAMAFWGWPKDQPNQIELAARAALTIAKSFSQDPDLRTTDFNCGVGLAHGEAIVGLMGVADLSKIDVFGPPVNRASRLESLTKQFGVRALIDEPVREGLRELERQQVAAISVMPRVQLAGMKQACRIFELYSPFEDPPAPRPLADIWQAAMEAFHRGDWNGARGMIDRSFRDLSPELLKDNRVVKMVKEWMNENTPPGAAGEVVLRLDKK
jgi:adenylate cyclase